MKQQRMSERALVAWLVFIMCCTVGMALALPFVLAIVFGDGWLYLNLVTIPAYFGFVFYIDRRSRE